MMVRRPLVVRALALLAAGAAALVPARSGAAGVGGQRYVVRRGDTVGSVAAHVGISVAELRRQLRRPLKPGQVLMITLPSKSSEEDQTRRDWVDSYRAKPGETLEAIAAELRMTVEELGDFNDLAVEYDVQPGDTLHSIAGRHHTTDGKLADWNELNPKDPVFPGMTLVAGWEAVEAGEVLFYPLRERAVEAVVQMLKEANGQYADGSARLLNERTRYETYAAKKGDTVERIAGRQGCAAADIRDLNGMAESEQPEAGELLYLPRRSEGGPPRTRQQRLSPGYVPVYAGQVVRAAPILQRQGGAVLFAARQGMRLTIIGSWGSGYAVLMSGGRYGWIARNCVSLGDLIGSTRTMAAPAPDARRLLEIAYTYRGVPYVFGGNSFRGIDCSAFVKNVFVAAGWWRSSAPRTARDQIKVGVPVSPDQLRPGDRIYFYNGRLGPGIADHTGIYIGGGQVIHASSSRGVSIASLFSPRMWRTFLGARRDGGHN